MGTQNGALVNGPKDQNLRLFGGLFFGPHICIHVFLADHLWFQSHAARKRSIPGTMDEFVWIQRDPFSGVLGSTFNLHKYKPARYKPRVTKSSGLAPAPNWFLQVGAGAKSLLLQTCRNRIPLWALFGLTSVTHGHLEERKGTRPGAMRAGWRRTRRCQTRSLDLWTVDCYVFPYQQTAAESTQVSVASLCPSPAERPCSSELVICPDSLPHSPWLAQLQPGFAVIPFPGYFQVRHLVPYAFCNRGCVYSADPAP